MSLDSWLPVLVIDGCDAKRESRWAGRNALHRPCRIGRMIAARGCNAKEALCNDAVDIYEKE